MSENMIILELLENAYITFDEALRLINALSQKSMAKDTNLPSTGGHNLGIKLNFDVGRSMDV